MEEVDLAAAEDVVSRRNVNIINNKNKRHNVEYYLHGTVPDIQTLKFTKVTEHVILMIQSEFVNGSDIAERIRKGSFLV